MIRLLLICLLTLVLCSACMEPRVKYDLKDVEQCNNLCVVDSDCVVVVDYCFIHASNNQDVQCFRNEHEKFMSTIGHSIKCPSPRPESDYRAICQQNQCTIQTLFSQTPITNEEPPERGIEMIEVPVFVATDQRARVTITLQTYPPDIPPPATIMVGSFALKDSCLVFEDASSKSKAVAVFPKGTTFDQEQETLETFFGETLVLGEIYTLQGGIVGAHTLANQDCPDQKAIIGPLSRKGTNNP